MMDEQRAKKALILKENRELALRIKKQKSSRLVEFMKRRKDEKAICDSGGDITVDPEPRRVIETRGVKKRTENTNLVVLCETEALKFQECTRCSSTLDLSKVVPPSKYSDPSYLKVVCQSCQIINTVRLFVPTNTPTNGDTITKAGRKKNPMTRSAVLGSLHTGMGATHLSGLMASMNARSISSSTFKRAEREVGGVIENVARSSCSKWKHVESQCSKDGQMKGSYDFGWQKNKRAHNSRTGQGTVVGYETKKCVAYTTRNLSCRKCEEASRKGVPEPPHDCRKNHDGSSKSMEPSAAVELFSNGGFSVLIGDDDSSVISRVRAEVDESIEKWSDVNHATCTFKRGLYEVRGKSFGVESDKITDDVIRHLEKCFSFCLHQNKNDAQGLKTGLERIIPHTFGDHSQCEKITWCKYKDDPTTYTHSNLPGGRPLKGEALKTFLTEHMKAFSNDQAVKKLAPLGSSQCNECLNGIVSTKNPKSRYYGGSESSDFRVAAAVAQYNESYDYLEEVQQQLSHNQNRSNLHNYIKKMSRKRKQQNQRKSQVKAKVRRRLLKSKKATKLKRQEQKEGPTYQSGIGFTEDVTSEEVDLCTETFNGHEVKTFLEVNQLLKPVPEVDAGKTSFVEEEGRTVILMFDLETAGFGADAEILQLSCVKLHGEDTFSRYILPTRPISPSATNVHNLTVGLHNGRKSLCKNGEVVQATPLHDVLQDLDDFLMAFEETDILLVGHNSNSFDAPRLVNALKSCDVQLRCVSQKNIYFGESLSALKKHLKRNKNVKLQDVYEEAMGSTFNAHDALEDCVALKKVLIFYGELVMSHVRESSKTLKYYIKLRDHKRAVAAIASTYQGKLADQKADVTRLSKLGIPYASLKTVYEHCGRKSIISFLGLRTGRKINITRHPFNINKIINSLK